MKNYDYYCTVTRLDGTTKTTSSYDTPGKARAAAKRFLVGHGGTWDMSSRVGEGHAKGLVTGGEHGRMSADGAVRIG